MGILQAFATGTISLWVFSLRNGVDPWIGTLAVVAGGLAIGAMHGLIAALIWGYLHVAAPITGTGLEFRVIGAVISVAWR